MNNAPNGQQERTELITTQDAAIHIMAYLWRDREKMSPPTILIVLKAMSRCWLKSYENTRASQVF
jgi:hypothetical protein